MITCPNPACDTTLEAFEVSTVQGLTGSRFVVECDECEQPFEVDVIVQEPRRVPEPVYLDYDDGLGDFGATPTDTAA